MLTSVAQRAGVRDLPLERVGVVPATAVIPVARAHHETSGQSGPQGQSGLAPKPLLPPPYAQEGEGWGGFGAKPGVRPIHWGSPRQSSAAELLWNETRRYSGTWRYWSLSRT